DGVPDTRAHFDVLQSSVIVGERQQRSSMEEQDRLGLHVMTLEAESPSAEHVQDFPGVREPGLRKHVLIAPGFFDPARAGCRTRTLFDHSHASPPRAGM